MKTTTLLGLALIAYNLYANAHASATGTGTDDDPIRIQTHSPLLALTGLALILGGESRG
jgi:hypothetical protein